MIWQCWCRQSVMSEIARFAAMMRRSAELKRRIAVELADAVVAVVDACEASLRARRQADVLRQWRVGGGQPASGDRNADPAARVGGAGVLAGAGADTGSGGADRGRQRLRL